MPTASAFRAYFSLKNNIAAADAATVRAFVLNFGEGEDHGQTNGIVEAEADSPLSALHSSAWYTLDGRKIVNRTREALGSSKNSSNRELPKGVYIHQGRKVVVK
jgi:hypothetical protein